MSYITDYFDYEYEHAKIINKEINTLSDLITEEKYSQWEKQVIFLNAGLGTGKTTFALAKYCKWLKSNKPTWKVLYLVNRISLRNSIKKKLQNMRLYNVDLMSYQKMVDLIYDDNMPQYDVIICDEYHYFMTDANFNHETDIAYSYILSKIDKVVIFASATYQDIESVVMDDIFCLHENPILNDMRDKKQIELIGKPEHFRTAEHYYFDINYGYINKIIWYRPDDRFKILDELLARDEKTILFVNEIKTMEKIYEHYKDSEIINDINFVCSKSQKGSFAKRICNKKVEIQDDNEGIHLSKDKVYQLEDGSYCFDEKLLISTSVMDNGLDFKDSAIKNIMTEIFNPTSAVQSIGRRRITGGETLDVYILDYDTDECKSRYIMNKIEKNYRDAELYINDYETWKKNNRRKARIENPCIEYDVMHDRLKINMMKYHRLRIDYQLLSRLSDENEIEFTYKKVILSRYMPNFDQSKSVTYAETRHTITLTEFLDMVEGRQMDDTWKDALIQNCNIRDSRGRLQRSYNKLQSYIAQYGYTLDKKRIYQGKERSTIWIVTKNLETSLNPKDTAE